LPSARRKAEFGEPLRVGNVDERRDDARLLLGQVPEGAHFAIC